VSHGPSVHNRLRAAAHSNLRQQEDAIIARANLVATASMHVHIDSSAKFYLPLFVANGVTGIRIMSGVPAHHRWREEVETGASVGPRMVIASAILDGPKQAIVSKMQQARVGILAGTDLGNPYLFPGFSLHDELAILVEAGLTPMEALQAATRNPARFLGREKDLGTVEQGKLADLVLLDSNPLADIHNTTKIHAVVANGKYYERATLDQMLANAEAAAAQGI
jgi:amidohydrolase family protein